MRMRYSDRPDTTPLADAPDGFGIGISNAVPQNITGRMQHQVSTLTDSEFGPGMNGIKIFGNGCKVVLVPVLHLSGGDPCLPGGIDVLTVVAADKTFIRRKH